MKGRQFRSVGREVELSCAVVKWRKRPYNECKEKIELRKRGIIVRARKERHCIGKGKQRREVVVKRWTTVEARRRQSS